MKYFSRDWPEIQKTIASKNIILFLDFDGTLTPIKKRPDAVTFQNSTREILKKLSRFKNVEIAIISGRGLTNVRQLVGIPNIVYAGNHGFEISGPKISFIKPQAKKAAALLAEIRKDLKKGLKAYPGVLVEDKKYTLSVHYRLLPAFKLEKVKSIFIDILEPHLKKKKVVITKGKKVWEIRPPVEWGKGEAVQWLLKKLQKKKKGRLLTFYFGDDVTDEDGFSALGKQGITVRVGMPIGYQSKAKYFLRNSNVVHLFLEELLETLEEDL